MAGYVAGGKIENCYVTGNVESSTGDSNVGGVAGYVISSGSVENCYTVCTVTGSNVGGVAGFVWNGSIENCYAVGKVVGANAGVVVGSFSCAGGVAGMVFGGSVTNCAALNSSVNGNGEQNMNSHRVVGNAPGSSTVSDNYAWNGMKINGKTVTGGHKNNTDGADLVYDSETGKFEIAFSDIFTTGAESVWNDLDNSALLPTLKSVPDADLQSSAIPAYIRTGVDYDVVISNVEELKKFRDAVNDPKNHEFVVYSGKKVLLTADIDLSGEDNWTPIGLPGVQFAGTFDGGGHVISNLKITSSENSQGLFNTVSGKVKNLGLEDVEISGGNYVGGVVGKLLNSGRIENCYVTGTIAGTVEDTDCAGGVAGLVSGGTDRIASIKNCYVTAEIKGVSHVGGVAGYVNKGSVTNCYATGAVTGSGSKVGGVAGNIAGDVRIANCYAAGAVSGGSEVGGVVGEIDRYSSGNMVENCVALNSSVESQSGDVHRVVGFNDRGGNMSGNHAWTNMGGNAENDYFGVKLITAAAGNYTKQTVQASVLHGRLPMKYGKYREPAIRPFYHGLRASGRTFRRSRWA